jgi:Holliday junction resolvase RusA-like endonuclease
MIELRPYQAAVATEFEAKVAAGERRVILVAPTGSGKTVIASAIIAGTLRRSWSGRRRALAVTGDLLPTSRPDVDNYIKAGLDSLNEIVVRDDSQVVEISARKRFSIAPKLVMTVFPLGAACSNRGARCPGAAHG